MSKKNQSSVLNMIERERHRVAATVTREQDWEQPEPNNGLARMFVIMLLIHVFVIGGIIIYDFIGGDTTPKSSQASGSVAPTRASSSSTASNISLASLPSSSSTPPSVSEAPASQTSAPKIISVVSSTDTGSHVPKALAYPMPTATSSSSTAPIILAHNNVSDPIPMNGDLPTGRAGAPAVFTTHTGAPENDKPKTAPAAIDKPKVVADKPKAVADKPKVAVADKLPAGGSSQPKPVMTPSAARKALEGDSKPPSATTASKKHDDADAPPAKKHTDADAPPSKKIATKASSHGTTKYTIAKGDTVYSLARRYKTSEEAIMKANGIKNANALSVGKSITIPASK